MLKLREVDFVCGGIAVFFGMAGGYFFSNGQVGIGVSCVILAVLCMVMASVDVVDGGREDSLEKEG